MSEHTREPWSYSDRNWRGEKDPHSFYIVGDTREGGPDDQEDEPPTVSTAVAVVPGNPTAGDIPEKTARRIVACVNAFAGVPTERVEQVGVAELRDALLTAIGALMTVKPKHPWVGEVLDSLVATVKKVQEQ